jgi:hypothetical protein
VWALALVMTMLMSPAPSLPSAIAVHWQGQPDHAQGDASLRLSVRELVAARDGRPVAAVPDRALARARVAVAYELPAPLRERHRLLRRELDEADAAYREGRFEPARAALVQVLDQLHASPELPGAAASAREAQLLTAKLAWAAGDLEVAESALAAALRIDPEAQLSVREAAPELVARYHAIQTALLASREHEWIVAQLSDAAGAGVSVEIDGVPGLRAVPPGPHFLVARRDGYEPVAAWQSVDQPWVLPAARERIAEEPELTIETIETVCEALALDVLLLAERRDREIGVQAHRCGVGFGPRWTGARAALADGIQVALDGPFAGATSTLTDEWPATLVEAPLEPTTDLRDDLPVRPWYRRGWIWGTGAGVAVAIVGGVAAGVVLHAREQPPSSLDVDAGKFIGGR